MMDVASTIKEMRRILTELLEVGFEMPILVTSIDKRGSLMVAEYNPNEKGHLHCEIIAQRMRGEFFVPPVNMIYADARGDVARALLETEGTRTMLH
jgi:hypothetical protein